MFRFPPAPATGHTYSSMGDLDRAEAYFEKARALCPRLGRTLGRDPESFQFILLHKKAQEGLTSGGAVIKIGTTQLFPNKVPKRQWGDARGDVW